MFPIARNAEIIPKINKFIKSTAVITAQLSNEQNALG